jgi:peptidyl-prolyl isomerase D
LGNVPKRWLWCHPDLPEDTDIELKDVDKVLLITKEIKNIGNTFLKYQH